MCRDTHCQLAIFIRILFDHTIPILASSIYFSRADDQATARIPGYSVAAEGCGLKLVGYETMAVTLYKVQEIAVFILHDQPVFLTET